MIRWEAVACVVPIAAFVLWLAALAVVVAKTERGCLAAGYPEYHVAWDFSQYCTREENEYEITLPLEEARGRQD